MIKIFNSHMHVTKRSILSVTKSIVLILVLVCMLVIWTGWHIDFDKLV